jgi:diketogulonate reductase-like aldo/keto reductase
VYRNEEEVGQAIKASALPRSSIWLTTKWSGTDGKGCKQSIQESLSKLGVDYVDLYLIHSPRVANGDISGAWKEMEEVKKNGWAKSIGVSK